MASLVPQPITAVNEFEAYIYLKKKRLVWTKMDAIEWCPNEAYAVWRECNKVFMQNDRLQACIHMGIEFD